MRNGISAKPVDESLPYAEEINTACQVGGFSPLVAYAVKWNETADLPNAATVVSADDGHGLFQLTASWPSGWRDPYTNALYAVDNFLVPAETYWAPIVQGEDLVRCIAAEFNAGRSNAIAGHQNGDVDKYTTNDYGRRALATYHKLLSGVAP